MTLARLCTTSKSTDPEALTKSEELTKKEKLKTKWAALEALVGEEEIDLEETNADRVEIEKAVQTATAKHNAFLKEPGLPELP